MKAITLNPGQRGFVFDERRYPGFVGGVGSGKTFTGIIRGLEFSKQERPPGMLHGPRGAILAIHYNELEDVVLPEFFEIVEGTGLLKEYQKSKRKAVLWIDPNDHSKGTAEILFRSLDNPNWRRGLQLSWFFIDEARNVTYEAWKVLIGRLRQPGYKHSGWVATTPNGFDWVYDLFHPKGKLHKPGTHAWHGASTADNQDHLPPEYIEDLLANYEGQYLQQEFYGKFVGVTEGAVFSKWDQDRHLVKVEYDPALPLYSGWDFGVNDLQVILYAQVEYIEKRVAPNKSILVPKLRFLDAVEGKDMGAAEWAQIHHQWLRENTDRKRTDRDVGDPAGKQRNANTATSVIEDLNSAGVPIVPAPKRAPDYGIRILNNMMEGDRVVADNDHCERLSAAFSTHRWPTDANGYRTGSSPIHDWTSHYASAARYLAASLLDFRPKRRTYKGKPVPPGSAADIKRQLLTRPARRLGGRHATRRVRWQPADLGRVTTDV